MTWYQIACLLGVPGLLAALYGLLWREMQARRKEAAALRDGMQAMLRAELIRSYYHYEARGWITLHGLEAIDLAYKAYHDLGGNGAVTKLVHDLRELEVRDEKWEDQTGEKAH